VHMSCMYFVALGSIEVDAAHVHMSCSLFFVQV
jgi:hypothetical protein